MTSSRWMAALVALVVVGVGTGQLCSAQSSLRAWGTFSYDTEGRQGRFVGVSAGLDSTAVLRSDGRAFVNGESTYGNNGVPVLAGGLRYLQVSITSEMGVGVVSDGSLRSWGQWNAGVGSVSWQPWLPSTPSLPAGVWYVQADVGARHAVALRSDGLIEAWGHPTAVSQGWVNVPALPAGLVPVRVRVGGGSSLALLSDGSIIGWGSDSNGQLQVPTLPAGVVYEDVSIEAFHCVALRSDGQVEAWGDNQWGQLNVPPLPGGLTYTHVAAGRSASCAVRSDDTIVAWGHPLALVVVDVPDVPPGLHVRELDIGNLHAVALLTDGSLLTWGQNGFGQSTVPARSVQDRYMDVAHGASLNVAALARGGVQAWGTNGVGQADVPAALQRGSFVQVGAGGGHAGALRSDGQLFCWGDNQLGQCNVPPLPAGVTYTDFRPAWNHSVAIRSDGQAVAWGDPSYNKTTIPPLPPGQTYVRCDAHEAKTLLLRSDGEVISWGRPWPYPSQYVAPAPSPGLRYVEVAAAVHFNVGILSDGTADWWGGVGSVAPHWLSLSALPPLPFGVHYVEVNCGDFHAILRRSDGLVDVCGNLASARWIPPLDPGTSYVGVDAGWNHTFAARIGPTCTYVSFAAGCSGTLAATRLVPSDTPRIGKTMTVRLFDLPVDIAMMTMGLTQLSSPLRLNGIGMPGCSLQASIDAVAVLVGQNQQAEWSLPIPDVPSLVGLHFYNQALVLDPGAGNGLGAVVSDAAEGVVGHW